MESKFKILVKILFCVIAFLMFWNMQVNAQTEIVDGLEWSYTVENEKAVNVYISSGIVPATITVPDTLRRI